MKEVSLNDLKRLVETLDSDAPIPEVVEEKEEYPSLIVEAAKEVQENIFKTILQEIQDNQKQIAELKEEVSNIPEAKSYDVVRSEVSSLNVEEDKTLIEEAVELLPEQTETVSDPLLQAKVDTLSQLQSQQKLLIQRLQTQLATVGGGGETRLEFLDDVDRDSVKVDGKYLQYQSSTGKFIGADASGGGGSGVTTALVRDAIQGYYGIETDYYTVGIANTTQEVLAGITSMIMPQVASDRIFQHLPTIMTGVGTNPYVGTGATVGTGQTEFSFAGLSSGASCVVRTALAFTPDEDNTNLDIQLKFTTNTSTQSAGTTNFTILKESALIMNEGADQQYITENVFSFPVGTRLEGTTYGNSGSFNIEVIPTSDGTLEVLAVTVSVVA